MLEELVSNGFYPNESVMYQLQYYYNFIPGISFKTVLNLSMYYGYVLLLKTIHELFKILINREDLMQSPQNQQLCELVPMISSGICADYNNQSAVPLTAFNPARWIHYSNTNLSFLDQATYGILTQHIITWQGEANRSLRKTCVRVPLALHKQPTLLNHKIPVITIEYQIFSLLKKRVSKG